MAGKSLKARKADAVKLLMQFGYKVEEPGEYYRNQAKQVLSTKRWQVKDDADVDIVDNGAWVTVRMFITAPEDKKP